MNKNVQFYGSFISYAIDPNTNTTYYISQPSGYEGVKTFSIASTKITSTILQYWLNQASSYQAGPMKSAYGTFLTALMVEYCHDTVADNLTSNLNVTWSRTSPIVVSTADDFQETYLTIEGDESMGMTVVGLPKDMFEFRFICSSAISNIEYNIMNSLEFNYQANTPTTGLVGSVMTDMMKAFLNGTNLEAFESNGYIVLKEENRTDLLYVIDPETGIVRDINTKGNFCGAYCFYNLQTNLAETLGNDLLSGSQIPTHEQLEGIMDNVNKLQRGDLPEEYGGSGPSKIPFKLSALLSLLSIGMVTTGNSNFETIYDGTVTSNYTSDNTSNSRSVVSLNTTTVNTNQSIIRISEIKKNGT